MKPTRKVLSIYVALHLVAIAATYDFWKQWLAPRTIDRRQLHQLSAEPRTPNGRHVVLISIDGLSPVLLKPSITPVLHRLAREGTSLRARALWPTRTLPSHASMLSGLVPAKHRLLWNEYEPRRRVTFDTVFSYCARSALRCGLFATKLKFAHFAEHEPGVELYQYATSATGAVSAWTEYVKRSSPHFTFVHFSDVDDAGHAHGWNSSRQAAAARVVDSHMLKVVRAVSASERPTTILITSDHGGWGRDHEEYNEWSSSVPWIVWGDGVAIPVASVRTRELPSLDVVTPDTAATVLAFLGVPAGSGLDGRVPVGLRGTVATK